jgi:hypothetical protein
MPFTTAAKKLSPEIYLPLIMLIAGAAIAATTLLLAVSRFASIENRTEALGPLTMSLRLPFQWNVCSWHLG